MRHAILLFSTLILCSCNTVQVVTPNPRVEPPELRGDRGLKIALEPIGAHIFKATNDGSSRPPDVQHPTTTPTESFTPGLLYSPAAPLEAGIELSPLSLGVAGVLKWQPLGEGSRTATEGNVPLALYLRVGTVYTQQSGDQKDTFGPGGYAWKGSINGTYAHSGVSVGYRTGEHVLIYAGAAFGQYWLRTEVDQSASGTDPGGVYKTGHTGYGNTGAAGLLFNWQKVQFFVSGEFTHIEYNHTNPMDDVYFHGGVYFTPR